MSGNSNETTPQSPTRRGFLGLILGAIAAPVIAPVVVPKRSFFSFFLPKRLVEPDFTFDLQKEIDALSAKGGGIVRLPSGIHVVGKSIVLPDDVCLGFEGNALIADCIFRGEPKKISNPRGVFISDSGDQSGQSVVTGCFFDMNKTKRPMIDLVIPGAGKGET